MNISSKVIRMFRKEVRRPVRIRAAIERIRVPTVKIEIEGLWDCYVGIHTPENGEYLLLYKFIWKCLNPFRKRAL